MMVQKELDEGNFLEASYGFFNAQFKVYWEVDTIDFYNVLTKETWFNWDRKAYSVERLSEKLKDPMFYNDFMMQLNNVAPKAAIHLPVLMEMVHEALELPSNVRWNSFDVFTPLLTDFMKPVVHIVEKLLDETSVQVAVFNGNVDLICATPGTVAWVNRLNWHGKEEFSAQRRVGYAVNDVLEGYFKRFDNLNMYWVSLRQSKGAK
jgi:serine carboxypeptidase 1